MTLARPFRRQAVATLLALGAPLFACHGAHADDRAGALVRAIKATYLVKLPAFVAWPGTSHQSFNLCVVGNDPFGDVLNRAAQGQAIDGVPIRVLVYPAVDGPNDCQVMYIGGTDPQAVLQRVHGFPVLTVTDGQQDPADRGIVNFVIVDNRVRFQIDDVAAAANGLVISSKLLSIAVAVRARVVP